MGVYRGPYSIKEGLVVLLDPTNIKSYPGTGSIVYDISIEGVKADTTFYGTHTINENGIYLDGVTGYGWIPQPSVTFGDGGATLQEWTIGMFFLSDADSGFVISPSSGGADHALRYSNSSSGIWTFGVTESSDVNNRTLNSLAGTVPYYKWTYVVCTLKGLEMEIYINGKLNVTRTNDTPVANWINDWRIGARAIFSDFFTRCTINNLHVYNRRLSATEIRQNFNAYKGRFSNLINID